MEFSDPVDGAESELNGLLTRLVAVNIKNITVSVDDDVYYRSRVRAAELRTSVSALVRKALQDLACQETEADRLRRLEA